MSMRMKLPQQLTMREVVHGRGDKGMAFYGYEDIDGLGVVIDARRKNGRSAFVETYRFKWLPDQEFASYQALRNTVELLTDEDIAAERAKWPRLSDEGVRERTAGSGNCWTHKDRPSTHHAFARTSWISGDGLSAMLCAECAQQAATDVTVIVRASDQRRADVLARHSGAFSGMVAR
jgi:hypothetical protein